MPIYEYACRKCHRRVEVLQKMSDKPLTRCQHCGGRLERLWSPVGIQFKGTGWYVTDYGRKSSGATGNGKSSSEGEAKDTTSRKEGEVKQKTTA